jgi:hypothetical protein
MANLHYSHTQTSPIRYILVVVIFLSLLTGWLWRSEFWAWFSMAFLSGVCLLILLTMTSLTIQDTDESLEVKFGPLPLFSTHIPFEDIRAFRPTRSRVVDGWGIHYLPGRGWTWSLWGFDCVDIERRHSTLRLGTDDPANLAAFLERAVGS